MATIMFSYNVLNFLWHHLSCHSTFCTFEVAGFAIDHPRAIPDSVLVLFRFSFLSGQDPGIGPRRRGGVGPIGQ